MTDHVAGDIARTMPTAPPRSTTDTDKADKKAKGGKGNPLIAYLGAPTFRLNAAPKWYEDKTDKMKQNMKVAEAIFNIGSTLVLSASIYMERQIVQDATGRKAKRYLRFSLPRAVKVADGMTEHTEDFKTGTVMAFQQWQAETGTTIATSAKLKGGVVELPDEDMT